MGLQQRDKYIHSHSEQKTVWHFTAKKYYIVVTN